MSTPIKNAIPSYELQPDDEKYLKGTENFLIRMYFYLQNGLYILNDFHNVFLGMIALTVTFKITSPAIIACILVPSFFFFLILGRYNVHTMAKLREWISTRFSTHYGIQSFNFNQGQFEVLVEIRDLLKQEHEQISLLTKKVEALANDRT